MTAWLVLVYALVGVIVVGLSLRWQTRLWLGYDPPHLAHRILGSVLLWPLVMLLALVWLLAGHGPSSWRYSWRCRWRSLPGSGSTPPPRLPRRL